jgi:uncharacterized protein involved in outer membrane biogenesis
MARVLGWLALLLLVIVVAAGGLAAYAIHALTAQERLKPALISAVESATGRTLTIGGSIGVKLSLVPTLVIEDVSLANPPGFSRPDLIRIGRVELSLALMPLLHRRVEVAHIALDHPDLLLETSAAGQTNWSSGKAASKPPAPAPAAPPTPTAPPAQTAVGGGEQGFSVSVNDIQVTEAKIGWKSGAAPERDVSIPHLTIATQADQSMRLDGAVAFEGKTLTIAAHTGSISGLTAGNGGAPWPLDLTLGLDGARLAAKGTLGHPMDGAGTDLTIDGAVPDLQALVPAAPAGTKNLTLALHFTGMTAPVSFQVHAAAGDLSGALTVGSKARPSVSGQIASTSLDLDALLGRQSGGHDAASHAAGPSAPAGGPKPVLPTQPLPFAALKTADADIRFRFDRVRLDAADIQGLTGALALKDGLLRLDPISATSPGLAGSLSADASKVPSAVHLTMKGPALPLAGIIDLLGLPKVASGTAEVRADLRGTGESPHEIAASLGGWAGVAVAGGQLDMKTIHAMFAHFGPFQLGGDSAELRCLAVRTDIKGGIATLTAAALGSEPLTAEGSGDIDLGRETLALHVRPRSRLGGTEVVLPGKVTGPWRAPKAEPDIAPDSVANGLAGLLLGPKGSVPMSDPCPRALALARDTTPPPAAAAAPVSEGAAPGQGAKPPKPADVLKQLLSPFGTRR